MAPVTDERALLPEQELLATERQAALRRALACLPPRGQQLLALLAGDLPVAYAQISATLGIAVGSIGPVRGRYLHMLRRHPALAALLGVGAVPAADPAVPATSGTALTAPTPAGSVAGFGRAAAISR